MATQDGFETGFADTILGAVGRNGSFTGDATLFIQLHTGPPGAAGTANVCTTNTRKSLTFAAPSGGELSSNAQSWTGAANEVATHHTVWTAVSAGSFRWSGAVANGSITSGQTFTLPSGAVSLTATVAIT